MANKRSLHRYNLYLKWPRDREIIDWLDAQENASRAIRNRLAGIFEDTPGEQAGRAVTIDAGAVQEAVVRALDDRQLTLPGVRQVVEAALREALSGISLAGGSAPADPEPDGDNDWFDAVNDMIIE